MKVVTVISSFRIRYVVDTDKSDQFVKDFIKSNEVEEFSQLHLGETVIDVVEMGEQELVKLFDKDHTESDSKIFLSWPDATKLRNVVKI